MDAAVKDEASHFSNVKVLSTDAKGDVAKLTSDVEHLLKQDVDAFVVSDAWIKAAPAALEAINQAKVPVVMVDRLLKGGDFTTLVGPDNRAMPIVAGGAPEGDGAVADHHQGQCDKILRRERQVLIGRAVGRHCFRRAVLRVGSFRNQRPRCCHRGR